MQELQARMHRVERLLLRVLEKVQEFQASQAQPRPPVGVSVACQTEGSEVETVEVACQTGEEAGSPGQGAAEQEAVQRKLQ